MRDDFITITNQEGYKYRAPVRIMRIQPDDPALAGAGAVGGDMAKLKLRYSEQLEEVLVAQGGGYSAALVRRPEIKGDFQIARGRNRREVFITL